MWTHKGWNGSKLCCLCFCSQLALGSFLVLKFTYFDWLSPSLLLMLGQVPVQVLLVPQPAGPSALLPSACLFLWVDQVLLPARSQASATRFCWSLLDNSINQSPQIQQCTLFSRDQNLNKPKAFHTSFSSSWNRDETRNCEMKKKLKIVYGWSSLKAKESGSSLAAANIQYCDFGCTKSLKLNKQQLSTFF
jgi:hypothetical protein